jgi:hypothetical protein
LILLQRWREKESGLRSPDDSRELDGVGRANFQVSVAVEFGKFYCRAQQCCRFFSFCGAFGGCAIGTGFTARANYQVHGPAGMGFPGDDPSTTELDVVGMRAKDEQCGLIRIHD